METLREASEELWPMTRYLVKFSNNMKGANLTTGFSHLQANTGLLHRKKSHFLSPPTICPL